MSLISLAFTVLALLTSTTATAVDLAGLEPAIAEAVKAATASTDREVAAMQQPADRARAWAELGMLYQAQHLGTDAETAYQQSIRETGIPEVHYLYGVLLAERGDLAGAIAQYRQVPDDAATAADLAAYRLGVALLTSGDLDGATAALDRIRQSSASAVVLVARADVAMALGDTATARDALEEAARLAPEAGRIAWRLATVYRKLGNTAMAQQWLGRRNDVAPAMDDPLLLEVAGRSLSPQFFLKAAERAWERGDLDGALLATQRASDLDPGGTEARFQRVRLLLQRGDLAGTASELDRIEAIDPDLAEGWYLRAQLLLQQGSLTNAVTTAERAVALEANEPARRLLAALYLRSERFADAALQYRALLATSKEHAYYGYWLALSLLGDGDCAAARAALNRALAINRQWGEAYLVLTRADAICGDLQVREAALVRALALRKQRDSPDMAVTLAFAAAGVGRLDLARQALAGTIHDPDAKMLLEAIDQGSLPPRPFAPGSRWWLPEEVR